MIDDVVFWAFLAAVVPAYWLIQAAWRPWVLALSSLGLITYYDPLSACLLVILAGLLFALLPSLARRSKAGASLGVAIAVLALPLILLKLNAMYGLAGAGSSILRYAVPLGMSYYVFRLLHLAIEVYRGAIAPPNARDYVAYVFLFTIFVAGPILRFDDFLGGRSSAPHHTMFRDGLTRIAFGLIKQTAGIDLMMMVLRTATGRWSPMEPQSLVEFGAGQLWSLAAGTYLVSYLNLSAYTDIAIGSSRLLGLKVTENFNFPVAATSLPDFWRRWHMSLSDWCQTYVFSPVLGVWRNPHLAVIASFLVMGLWHLFTLNRLAWGMHQALALILIAIWRRRFRKRNAATKASRLWTLFCWASTQAYVSLGFLWVVNERSNDPLLVAQAILRAVTFGLLGT